MQAHTEPQSKNSKKEQVIEYLRTNIEGTQFLSSRDVTDAVNLSAKEIGSILSELSSANATGVTVEAWSYTNSTTWRVESHH
jgi:hypothetical protein